MRKIHLRGGVGNVVLKDTPKPTKTTRQELDTRFSVQAEQEALAIRQHNSLRPARQRLYEAR